MSLRESELQERAVHKECGGVADERERKNRSLF